MMNLVFYFVLFLNVSEDKAKFYGYLFFPLSPLSF
jgi:hypothetical protein